MILARTHLYLITLVLVLSPAAPTFAQGQPAGFISLPQFLTAVSAAHYTDYPGYFQVAVEGKAAFEAMRAHLLARYQGVTPTHSFLLGTQYVDCIPVMQQPSVRSLGLTSLPTPPPPPEVDVAEQPPGVSVQPLLERGLTDSFGNAIRCDAGTIPLRRVTLEDLSRFPTLRASFAKTPPPSLTCNQYYRYAVGQQVQPPIYGAQTTLAIWYPTINPNYGAYQHSLSQMWVEGVTSTKPLQTVEAGWTVDPYRTGTSAATLFIYWTADGYAQTGCYDTDCAGFVQTSNAWVLGAPNWPGPSVSGDPNHQVFFGPIQWTLQNGAWWLSAGFANLGYYPASIFNGGQMSLYANKVEFGGEVSSPSPPAFSQMGSGALASAGSLYAAYEWGARYFTSPGTYVNANLTLVDCNTNSSCHTFACSASPCNVFYFGGPGGPSCP
jgi:Neprosin